MDNLDDEHEDLANEVLDALTEKFKSLPVVDRNILTIATVEAAAMLVATEVERHIEMNEGGSDEALGRIQEYASLLFRSAAIALQDQQD